MNFIGIIAAIISAIRTLPQIIALVKEIMSLFHSLDSSTQVSDKSALLKEFRAALKLARETHDVSALEDFHKKLGALCADGMCDVPGAPRV